MMNKFMLTLFAFTLIATNQISYARNEKMKLCPPVDKVSTIIFNPDKYMLEGYNDDGVYFKSNIIMHKPDAVRIRPDILFDAKYNDSTKILSCLYHGHSDDIPFLVLRGQL